MKKFEYKLFTVSPADIMGVLAQYGNDGWQLVSMEYKEWLYTEDLARRVPHNKYTLILMREIIG